ncbi:MAG TPA: NfeD family protein [Casimicrobiaceae bacterium]|nr:NfeD family protein [Casimicrobiaceae bacterium]
MASYWIWWIVAAALVAAELITGTFYLLVVGIAVACGGVVAWLDGGAAYQWLTASVLGVAGVIALERWKRGRGRSPDQPSLDVGQRVRVESWGPARTARVSYRGSTWDAELASPDTPQSETMYIAATRGSVLILSDRRPAGT